MQARWITAIAFIVALAGAIVGATIFSFGNTLVGVFVTAASITVPFSLAKILFGRIPICRLMRRKMGSTGNQKATGRQGPLILAETRLTTGD